MTDQTEHDKTRASGANEISQRCPDETMICEALVREIGLAMRWTAVREAWAALLHVRGMAKQLNVEAEKQGRPIVGRGAAHAPIAERTTDVGEESMVRDP